MFSQLLEMVLQVAQGISDSWGCSQGAISLWSKVIRGPEFIGITNGHLLDL